MSTEVDLRELAIERAPPAQLGSRSRSHLLTRYFLPLVLLLGVAALAVWAAWEMLFPPREVMVIPVLATRAEVRREGATLFEAAGWIEPRPTPVRVAALAPGVVERLLVVEDQPVEQGEPVAELIRADAELTLRGARSDLALRQAEAAEAKADLAAAEVRLQQPVHLRAALAEADATLAKLQTELINLPFAVRRAVARREFTRSDYENKLSVKGVVPGRTIDEARSEMEAAEALVDELQRREESLVAEQRQLTQRRDALKRQLELLVDEIQARAAAAARVEAAAARVEQTRVSVAEAELRLERMTVRAPIAGRVYQIIGNPGATLTGGAMRTETYDGSTVVTLYQPHKLQVRVDVRFEDLPHVSLHQPVRIDNPALAEHLTGQVLFVSSEADIQKNTLQVKVAIDSPPPVLKPEMLMDVTFLAPPQATESTSADESDHEIRIFAPRKLIQTDRNASFVWTADRAAGAARKTEVETAVQALRDNGELVEVLSGLNASHRLIAGDLTGLYDGQRIRITGEQD